MDVGTKLWSRQRDTVDERVAEEITGWSTRPRMFLLQRHAILLLFRGS